MLKKIVGLFLLAFVFSSNVFAQAPKGMGKSDPEAKKVLDAVSAKFKTFKSVKASFTLKIENAAGKVQGVKTGTVLMKGVKYRVTITGQDIFCDGATIWTYDMAAKEVQISTLDNSSGSITPQKLFTNFYDKDFLFVFSSYIIFNVLFVDKFDGLIDVCHAAYAIKLRREQRQIAASTHY
jgi:outer membrane lipoprotein-sorting protein